MEFKDKTEKLNSQLECHEAVIEHSLLLVKCAQCGTTSDRIKTKDARPSPG